MWPIYLLGLSWQIPATPATNYLTLILKSLNFSTFTTNLLTIPSYCLFFIQLIFLTWFSEKINNRFLIIFFCQIWMLPLLIALEVLPGGSAYNWSRYALNALLVGYPYVHAIIGWYPFPVTLKANAERLKTSSGYDQPQRWLRSYPYRRLGPIQYVCTNWQYNLLQRRFLLPFPLPHRLR